MGNIQSISQEPAQYRAKADEQAKLRGEYFEKSKAAFARGDGAQAKELSNLGKAAGTEMERWNAKAAKLLYFENNKHRSPQEIDLHGLYVKEAIEFAELRIQEARARGDESIVIITGAGNNSPGNIARIKPAIEELVNKYNLSCVPNVPNRGCITVRFGERGGGLGWLWKMFSSSSCVVM